MLELLPGLVEDFLVGATNALDQALVGRFATFLYPPDVLKMEEADRVRVLTHISGDDAPSLNQWTGAGDTGGTVPILPSSAPHFYSANRRAFIPPFAVGRV